MALANLSLSEVAAYIRFMFYQEHLMYKTTTKWEVISVIEFMKLFHKPLKIAYESLVITQQVHLPVHKTNKIYFKMMTFYFYKNKNNIPNKI